MLWLGMNPPILHRFCSCMLRTFGRYGMSIVWVVLYPLTWISYKEVLDCQELRLELSMILPWYFVLIFWYGILFDTGHNGIVPPVYF